MPEATIIDQMRQALDESGLHHFYDRKPVKIMLGDAEGQAYLDFFQTARKFPGAMPFLWPPEVAISFQGMPCIPSGEPSGIRIEATREVAGEQS